VTREVKGIIIKWDPAHLLKAMKSPEADSGRSCSTKRRQCSTRK
jgi:hypothetical protein